MSEDFEYSPGWCPICGDPESVCEAYGGHPDIEVSIGLQARGIARDCERAKKFEELQRETLLILQGKG